jgi:outer membrane receptor for ferrienterochelin and colicin
MDQGNDVSIAIRGIGSSAGASTTGIPIDDKPIQERAPSIGSRALPKAFDLDRIEVLRGPYDAQIKFPMGLVTPLWAGECLS